MTKKKLLKRIARDTRAIREALEAPAATVAVPHALAFGAFDSDIPFRMVRPFPEGDHSRGGKD